MFRRRLSTIIIVIWEIIIQLLSLITGRGLACPVAGDYSNIMLYEFHEMETARQTAQNISIRCKTVVVPRAVRQLAGSLA